MTPFKKSVLTRYLAATLAVVTATLLRWPLQPWPADRYPFLFYFGTVALVAWRCGTGPAVLSIGLSLVAVAIYMFPPLGRFARSDPNAWISLLLFFIVSSALARLVLKLQDLRARAERARSEQARLLAYVRNVGHALTRASSLQAILDECIDASVAHLDGASACIWTFPEKGRALELRARAGEPPAISGDDFPIGQIAGERRPLVTYDVPGDPSFAGQDGVKWAGVKTFAGFPLVVEDRLIGVMAIFSPHKLPRAVLDVLGSVATEIAIGIERKRSEDDLVRQREWLRVALESIGDALIATDESARITLFNAVAEKLTGWTAAEAAGRPLRDVFRIVDEATRIPAENPALRALQEGTIVGLSNHTVLIARDGTEWPIDDSASPIRDRAGRVVGAVLIFRDISRRREAELRLQDSEARKAAVLEASPDGMITIDGEGRIVEFNPASERMFGFKQEAVVGVRARDLIIPARFWSLFEDVVAQFRETGEGAMLGQRREVTALKSDGTEFPVELALTPLSLPGPFLFTAHVRDLTARKVFEKRRSARIRVTEILAETSSIDEAMPLILQTVGQSLGWSLAKFWLVDQDANVLTCHSHWHEHGRLAERMVEDCTAMQLSRDSEEAPAIVWRRGTPSWIPDLRAAPASPRLSQVVAHGLRGCLACPISVSEEVLGVLEFLSEQVRDPDPDLLEMLGTLGGQIGLYLQRQRAEAALRSGDERLRLALGAGRMGTWEWDIAKGTVVWSSALEEIHGLEPGTFPGTFEAYQADMHPDDRGAVLASIQRALTEGTPHLLEYRLILPDGSLRWVEARGKLFCDAAGSPRNMIGVCTDITERKRIEAERSRLISIIEHSPNFIGLADEDQAVLFVNRAGLELVGLPGVGPLSRVIDFFPESEQPRVMNEILPLLFRDGHWDGEVQFRNFRTGETIPVMWNVFTIRERESSRPYFACVSTDISDRKRAEAEIRRREEQFHSLADSIPQLAWMAQPDGYITWYNKRWHEYTGMSLEAMQGWGWTQVHDPDRVESVKHSFRSALESGVPWEDLFPLRRHDGAMLWHLSRAMPIRDGEGKILQWFGTNTDITERLQLEESLKEADRRKDRFLATLAHELRNPLAPIRNALHLMKAGVADPEGLEQERAMAERQVMHLTRLVEDLMDVSRINSGKIELRKEVVPLSTVVRDAVNSVSWTVQERQHELSVQLPSSPILLEGDPTRLEQILWNLLNNAIKYTDPGGEITLAADCPDERHVTVRVRDNGLGIAPDVLPTIFGMFVQAGPHRGYARGGLGIGLNLVKNFVELHGGTIVASSAGEGHGSEFRVTLPIFRPANNHAPAAIPGPTTPAVEAIPRHKVLVVDDNEDAANSLARVLSRLYGQEVRVAHDGYSALERVHEFRPQIVLLDLGMPGLDGYEVARRLRAEPRLRGLRIIALTGWGQIEDRQRSHEAGFDAHLVKPLDPDLLKGLLLNDSDRELA